MIDSKYWLCNYFDGFDSNDWPEELKQLWKCKWTNFLDHSIVKQILSGNLSDTRLEDFNNTTLLSIGIACLQAFVQDNFVGPSLTNDQEFQQSTYCNLINETSKNIVTEYLMSDGEEVNVNVTHPDLLAISKLVLTKLYNRIVESNETIERFICRSWYLRYCYIHQLVIDEHTDELYRNISKVSNELLEEFNDLEMDIETKCNCVLEIIQCLLHYKRVWLAEEKLKLANETLNAAISIEGKLGVRTKYQQKALPQLLLKVTIDGTDLLPSAITHTCDSSDKLPTLLQLDDDVRLERIRFVNEEDNKVLNLPSTVQALVLTTFHYIQKSQPKDKLATEELMPYLLTLLQQEHGPWSIRIAALLSNITFESSHKRTVERSLRQCEQIFKLLTAADNAKNFHRLSFAYVSFIRPRWYVKCLLADLMVSLGLIKSALDLYLQIEKWHSVIECYNTLELNHKAAEIIRNELNKKETVELYCLLGDATDDKSYYEKAWELSNHRSGRAHRHLGCYYFAKKQYEEAIPYLEHSLVINSLQENVWARLGYAALSLERWELAAKAYRQYTNIEPNGYESWNNLAKAYLNLGDKSRAHKILHEALRCNFDNWKVWENFLIVSIDTGNFEDVLNAHHRLGELKEKYLDKEILGIVVKAIHENLFDADGRPAERLTVKAQNLLAHLCVQHPSEGVLFELAAKLFQKDPLTKAQKLQKAYRCYTQVQTAWSKDPDAALKVLNICQELCNASLDAFSSHTDSNRSLALSQLSSARLSTQGALKAAKDAGWEKTRDIVNELENVLDKIKNVLSS